MLTMKTELIRTTHQNGDFKYLIQFLDIDHCKRNGEEQSLFNSYNVINESDSVVIYYKEWIPIGCGCFKIFDKDTIEIKRMYVCPQNRN